MKRRSDAPSVGVNDKVPRLESRFSTIPASIKKLINLVKETMLTLKEGANASNMTYRNFRSLLQKSGEDKIDVVSSANDTESSSIIPTIHTRGTVTLECVIADAVSININQKSALDKMNISLNIDISRSA